LARIQRESASNASSSRRRGSAEARQSSSSSASAWPARVVGKGPFGLLQRLEAGAVEARRRARRRRGQRTAKEQRADAGSPPVDAVAGQPFPPKPDFRMIADRARLPGRGSKFA
jgi:hypothetical protein